MKECFGLYKKMPPFRRFRRGRRFDRRRRFRRRYGMRNPWKVRPRSVSRAAWAGYAMGRAIGMPEVKDHQTEADNVGMLNTWVTTRSLSDIPAGDDNAQRVGDWVRAQSLQLKFYISWDSVAGAATDVARIMILRGNERNGLAPTATSVFGSATPQITALLDPDRKGEFSVLYDKIIPRREASVVSTNVPTIYFDRQVKGHRVWFNTPAAGARTQGHYFLFIGSNVAANNPVLVYSSKLRYTDV